MDESTRLHLANLHSSDRNVQGASYTELMKLTAEPVDWAYEAWDELLEALTAKDNRLRSIASQLLANLAKSDPKARIVRDFEKLLAVTKDEKFVTARHAMQAIWRVGAAGKMQRKAVVEGLSRRFAECTAEKNCTLIRSDISEGLKKLYDAVGDDGIRKTALALIETETDPKYQKKYLTVWK
jgi:HEAT repeat protein